MIVDAHLRCSGVERADDVLRSLDEARVDVAVLLAPFLSEGFSLVPLAVMEAMAGGVPVIACKVGGIPDLVAHGLTGWLVDVGDCDGLATRVVEMLEGEVGRSPWEAPLASVQSRACHSTKASMRRPGCTRG